MSISYPIQNSLVLAQNSPCKKKMQYLYDTVAPKKQQLLFSVLGKKYFFSMHNEINYGLSGCERRCLCCFVEISSARVTLRVRRLIFSDPLSSMSDTILQ